jgi:N-dimethylarginine dimethylaminohydrolase
MITVANGPSAGGIETRPHVVTRRILMCRPTYYGIEYEINPWMNRSQGTDTERATRQWEELFATLTGPIGTRVELIEPVPGLPDMVFTANAGLVWGEVFVPSRFRHPERAGEEPQFERWFADHGFEIRRLPEECHFEGAGDALPCAGILWTGYHFRTDVRAHWRLSEMLVIPTMPLELVDARFYHLDTCFCPLDEQTAIYYPAAFDDYARRVLEANIPTLIAAEEEEASRFACNAVVVGRDVVLNAGCPKLGAELTRRGWTVHSVDLSEYLKAGGSAMCLTIGIGETAGELKA